MQEKSEPKKRYPLEWVYDDIERLGDTDQKQIEDLMWSRAELRYFIKIEYDDERP